MKSTIRAALVIASALPGIFVGGAPQAANQEFPNRPLRYIVAVPAGRRDRHHRPHRGRRAERRARQAGHHRQSGRCGGNDRRRDRGARDAGRLHALRLQYRVARGEPGALQEARLRSRARFRADRPDRQQPQRARHSSLDSGDDGRGIHRLRESPSRQAQLRIGRHRDVAAVVDGAVQDDGRHRPRPRSRTRAAGRCWWP